MKAIYKLYLLFSMVIIASNCRPNGAILNQSGIEAQRALIKIEILVNEKKYNEAIPYLEQYKLQLNSESEDIVLKELVNLEDILKDIDEIIIDINTKSYSNLDHDVDRLKVHVANRKKKIGGDLQLYSIWELENILHLMKGVTEDTFINNKQELKKINKALLITLKTITLSKTGYAIVKGEQSKHNNLNKTKDQLVKEVNKYLHEHKEEQSYADFQSKTDNLQNAYFLYLYAAQ